MGWYACSIWCVRLTVFVNLHERLVLEFFNSFVIDEKGRYSNGSRYICFRFVTWPMIWIWHGLTNCFNFPLVGWVNFYTKIRVRVAFGRWLLYTLALDYWSDSQCSLLSYGQHQMGFALTSIFIFFLILRSKLRVNLLLLLVGALSLPYLAIWY